MSRRRRDPEVDRYARQAILPEVGAAGQGRLAAARVLVVGAGGLAAPVIAYLAGAGVGHLAIIDPDRVEITNLHRQVLFTEGMLGAPKAGAAAGYARALNADIAVEPVIGRLDPANAPALVGAADLVIDAADSFAAAYTASDACLAAGVPLISASVLGREGYAGGFCGRGAAAAPSLRAVFPDLPARAATCATAGVMGPVVGMIGAMQAQMALGVLLDHRPSPLGQMVTVDAGTWRIGRFRFDGAAEPAHPWRFLAPDQIPAGALVVELRGEDEAPAPLLPHARRLTVDAVSAAALAPAPGQTVVMVCRSGLRSWAAARRLAADWDGPVALVAAGS
ncbi:MAG: HesA/MoeB/ThiF family protein [Pseudomonadota bacterium]